MGKTVAILQSNYIPWKGYFDLMRSADEFVVYDDVQYTKNDWRNRNRIKTPEGLRWLTIPVDYRFRRAQTVRETRIADPAWAARHADTLRRCYAGTPGYALWGPRFEALYRGDLPGLLSAVNLLFLDLVREILGITTPMTQSCDYRLEGDRNARLVDLCLQVGAERYLSGPAARGYLDEAAFAAAGITVDWMDYAGYPEYPQRHPPFVHGVSVLDLLFNVGADAARYLDRA